MLDAKRALEQTSGNFEEARKWLRVNGLAGSSRREDRESSEGAVAIVRSPASAAIAELRCETDFVAKSPDFVRLSEELAADLAAEGEAGVAAHGDDVDKLRAALKENITIGRLVRFELSPGSHIGSYLHVQNDRGVNAVLVELEGGDDELAHEIAVHIAFARPAYISKDEVPEEEVATERATVEEISRKEKKPEAAMAKIVEGRLRGWFKERCLMEQDYVRDEKRTIAELLGGARVVRFAQVVVGS